MEAAYEDGTVTHPPTDKELDDKGCPQVHEACIQAAEKGERMREEWRRGEGLEATGGRMGSGGWVGGWVGSLPGMVEERQ